MGLLPYLPTTHGLQKPNKLNEPNELNKLKEPNKPDKLNKPNEPNRLNKPNYGTMIVSSALTATF